MKDKGKILIGLNVCGILFSLAFGLFYFLYFAETVISSSRDKFEAALAQNGINPNVVETAERLLRNIQLNQIISKVLLVATLVFLFVMLVFFASNIILARKINKNSDLVK